MDFQEWSELDEGQVENIDREIRRVVEAKRKEQQERSKARKFVSQKRKRQRKKQKNGRSDSWKKEGERKKYAEKSGENSRRKGVMKMTMSGFRWCLTWR